MTLKYLRYFLFTLALAWASGAYAQPSVDAGKTLFRNYCATCHAKDMKTASTGPALGGSQERWADYPQEDLYGWVRNSSAMIAAGHPRAVELWNQYKPTVMTAWPNLTDDDIASIFLYIDEQYTKPAGGAIPTDGDTGGGAVKESSYNWLYYLLFGLLAVLAVMMTRIIGGLDRVVKAKDGVEVEEKSLWASIFTPRVVSFLIFGAVLFAGYNTVTRAIGLGRQQGYAPEQPINFSHAIHAGDHKIDCQYCHDGARRSKHAVIPATNTCMNCHAAIKNGSQFGTAELTKIYVSSGYDPSTSKYIEDYESLSQDEVAAIYKKWIGDQYMEGAGLNELDRKGTRLVEKQWSDIVSKLTNDQKEQVQGAIEWVRVHNLPDHVYFNHSQHVTVGGIECQDCHGKVEEMDVVSQHAPLSMGWCINCHRETEVNFANNAYYKNYELYHDQLKNGTREKVTVEDIGGLECQKCHY